MCVRKCHAHVAHYFICWLKKSIKWIHKAKTTGTHSWMREDAHWWNCTMDHTGQLNVCTFSTAQENQLWAVVICDLSFFRQIPGLVLCQKAWCSSSTPLKYASFVIWYLPACPQVWFSSPGSCHWLSGEVLNSGVTLNYYWASQMLLFSRYSS